MLKLSQSNSRASLSPDPNASGRSNLQSKSMSKHSREYGYVVVKLLSPAVQSLQESVQARGVLGLQGWLLPRTKVPEPTPSTQNWYNPKCDMSMGGSAVPEALCSVNDCHRSIPTEVRKKMKARPESKATPTSTRPWAMAHTGSRESAILTPFHHGLSEGSERHGASQREPSPWTLLLLDGA